MTDPGAFDPISVLERAYALHGTEGEWIDGLLETVSPEIDRGIAVYGFSYRWDHGPDRGTPRLAALASGQPLWANLTRKISEGYIAATVGTHKPCSTISQQLATSPLHMRELNDRFFSPNRFADILGVHAADPDGGVLFASALPKKELVSSRNAARWSRITAHIATALRLRRRIEQRAIEGEAVLSPSGSVLHATGPARDISARDRLRAAARSIDRSRGFLRRSDPSEALEIWRALCEGRWSLVDRFDSDGRRYLVAHRNEPAQPDLRKLTQREATVVALVRLGQSNKEIAYALGISLSSVATHLTGSLRKLGLPSRAGLLSARLGQGVSDIGDHS